MKALIFEKSGIQNLKVEDVQEPVCGSDEVLIKVKMAGVNPMDNFAVNTMPNVKPMPHILGAEFAGTIDKVEDNVVNLKEADKVIVYNRVFDGSCDMCISNNEMLCRTGGIMSVITNGGYAEYTAVPSKNAFKIPNELSWEMKRNKKRNLTDSSKS